MMTADSGAVYSSSGHLIFARTNGLAAQAFDASRLSLIGEPIAQTGQFGRMDGMAFLSMVVRKVKWLQKNVGKLVELAEG